MGKWDFLNPIKYFLRRLDIFIEYLISSFLLISQTVTFID